MAFDYTTLVLTKAKLFWIINTDYKFTTCKFISNQVNANEWK